MSCYPLRAAPGMNGMYSKRPALPGVKYVKQQTKKDGVK